MAGFFEFGEQKIRPGIYKRYENIGGAAAGNAAAGVCAAVFPASSGPVNTPITLDSPEGAAAVFGGSVAMVSEMFKGGAKRVIAVRAGTGGTQSAVTLKSAEENNTDCVKICAKYAGEKTFSITVRDSIADTAQRELLLYDGQKPLCSVLFVKGGDEAQALVDALRENTWITAEKLPDSAGTIETVQQRAMIPGVNPEVTTDSCSEAFSAIEPLPWDVLAAGTNDPAVHALLAAYIKRVYAGGKLVMGAVGETSKIPFEARLSHAAAFNDKCLHYVLNGWYDVEGQLIDGYLAAARIAGMIAGIPSNRSLTHTVINGAAELSEALTNSQYEKSILSGAIAFSRSSKNQIWVESGVNTLVSPGMDEDDGWKKIKRVKVRFELMNRISAMAEPMIGKVNNNPDGQATIIQAIQGILNTMAAEEKLLSGAKVQLDTGSPPAGDSAWFLIQADDVDALEKMYFVYRFRYTAI